MSKVNTKHNNSDSERKVLLAAAKKSSQRARQASLALGLTVKSIEDGYIVETLPNGKTNKLREVKKAHVKQMSLKKGMTLCRK